MIPTIKNEKRGFQTLICNKTNLGTCVVSNYFNNRAISNRNIDKIEQCLSLMGRNYLKVKGIRSQALVSVVKNKRTDILKALVKSDIGNIAINSNCSVVYVYNILKAESNQNTPKGKKIIKEAEKIAAVNCWKTFHCKFKSEL